MAIHPELAPISFLIGIWTGTGHGDYPTIESFDYDEEVTITAVGPKPMLGYSQLTKRASTGEPLHSEIGYFRAVGDGAVELVVAQPTGIVEVHVGTLDEFCVELQSSSVSVTPTAREVRSVERRIEVRGDRMTYRLSMAAVGQTHQLHLEAVLQRG